MRAQPSDSRYSFELSHLLKKEQQTAILKRYSAQATKIDVIMTQQSMIVCSTVCQRALQNYYEEWHQYDRH